jgi:hypothetical protein
MKKEATLPMIKRFMQKPRGRVGQMKKVIVLHRASIVAFAVLGFSGCGGVQAEFLGSRIQDRCDGVWNVCATTVGCMLGDTSYVSGRFPGSNSVGFRLFEPSTVTVSFLLSETSGSGTQTVINFYEESCSSRIRTEVPGKTFLNESDQVGYVARSADLSGVGDHLIEVDSDARSKYLLKLDILPLRLKNTQ